MKVKLNKSKNIDSKILRLSPPNEKEKELSNSSIREDESIEFVTKLKILLKDMVFAQKSERNFHRENNPTPENENIKTKSQVRLPKHELKTSDGNALNWQSFWDRFDSSNPGNTDLNGIEKFSCLQSFLCFSVSESGLTAIAENYTEAKNILHERYGNTRVQIIALVKGALMQI